MAVSTMESGIRICGSSWIKTEVVRVLLSLLLESLELTARGFARDACNCAYSAIVQDWMPRFSARSKTRAIMFRYLWTSASVWG